MAFNPSSTIYLCSVPIDSTYKNEIYFDNLSNQQAYFSNRVIKSFSNYLTVRKSLSDGSLQSSVKVEANIDSLQNCNYMYYQNANHGTKYFYAFITKMIYINEATTELIFETDVYQTWLFNVELKPSYVVREHSVTDSVASNITPEKFAFQDYVYEKAVTINLLDTWGYLIGTTKAEAELVSNTAGHNMCGIYQGLYFYYYDHSTGFPAMADFLESLDEDCIQFICLIPKFNTNNNFKNLANPTIDGNGFMYASESPAEALINFSFSADNHLFNGYKPKNNKLYTSPFIKLVVTNHNGEQAEYNIEDFQYNSSQNPRDIRFKMYGDVSANPSVTLIPISYKGIEMNYDCGISIGGFPQCSYMTDTFKLWLAKNQFGVALDTAGNIGQIIAGIALTTGSGGTAGAIGATQIVSGATGILNTINGVYQASKEPNKANTGNTKNNLLTAIKMNKFEFYWQRIKKEYAKTIDDFFTMYGYATNLVKVPNVSSRPYFNYVQTVDVNIVGGIPSQDMELLKSVYNNGVTLWKPSATIGDYSVNNSPQ